MREEQLLKVLIAPHISEKSSSQAERNQQYVFKISKNATKKEVKQAVEQLFNVKVDAVSVCNIKGKTKRFAQTLGQRKGWKKAYVSLKEGHKIDFGDTQA